MAASKVAPQSAIELARELVLQVELRQVHVQELFDADDAFLTSSVGGIFPVRSVNGQLLILLIRSARLLKKSTTFIGKNAGRFGSRLRSTTRSCCFSNLCRTFLVGN
ncbi:aminotransferase class IV [Pseudomonas sp. ICMP 561]|uniref:aminotransferase class IV n=1 Tax=Pseudomonas sp. ICMP 561 TaxID=1718918 RepID=UPI000C08E482|nr:hypothetical protein AO242_21020 [Pseudomonas sp. ICMP 561]